MTSALRAPTAVLRCSSPQKSPTPDTARRDGRQGGARDRVNLFNEADAALRGALGQ